MRSQAAMIASTASSRFDRWRVLPISSMMKVKAAACMVIACRSVGSRVDEIVGAQALLDQREVPTPPCSSPTTKVRMTSPCSLTPASISVFTAQK